MHTWMGIRELGNIFGKDGIEEFDVHFGCLVLITEKCSFFWWDVEEEVCY
jgi:hypothetical protein